MIMKSFLIRAKIAFLTAGLMLVGTVADAQAGLNLGETVLTESTSALRNLLDSIVSLLQVVMGIGAIVVLAIVIFQVFKGEREAAQKLAWWVVGLTLGFTLLSVVSGLID